MRVTQQTKERTRARIVAAARRLFSERGFEATTTRELAAEAGIAAGTLFNYFPGKEALGAWILAETAAAGVDGFGRERRDGAALAEELFALVAGGLRALEPCRGWIGEVLEGAQSPLRWTSRGDAEAEEAFRVTHLDAVAALLAEHDLAHATTPVSLHLYWTLYLGALAFWARDDSPHREDTLALLDRSLQLFVRSLREEPTD
jgi:AcrR family transcriptional regulator